MTKRTRPWAALLLGGLVALLCSACLAGGDGVEGPGSEELPPADVGPVPAGLVDPCDLLTTAEVSQFAGTASADGARQATVDSTYVSCWWLAADDPVKIAPIVGVELFVVNDEMKDNVRSDLSSGKGEALPGVGDTTEVQAADLGTVGNSYAAGWKGTVFYRLQCNTPLHGSVVSKRICVQAATAVATRLA